MPFKSFSKDWVFRYMCMAFKGEVQADNINCIVFTLYQVIKATQLEDVIKNEYRLKGGYQSDEPLNA